MRTLCCNVAEKLKVMPAKDIEQMRKATTDAERTILEVASLVFRTAFAIFTKDDGGCSEYMYVKMIKDGMCNSF
jgi:hypothetical protein